MERRVDIKASVETIFKIIDDDMDYARWNLVIKKVEKLGEGNYFFKTTVGDVTSWRVETLPNKGLSARQEGSPITALGYELNPKGDVVETILWVEFAEAEQEVVLGIAGDMFIDCLRKYAEFLDAGGNPDDFNKRKAK